MQALLQGCGQLAGDKGIQRHAAGAQFTGLVTLLALISHHLEHQLCLFSQIIFRLAAARLPLVMVQANKLLALELLEQGLSDRQSDAKAGRQLGGTQRFAGQGGKQVVAALGQPAVIQQPVTGGDLLGALVKSAGQHIAIEPQLQGGRVVALQVIRQLAQQGVQRLASGGVDVTAPDDAGAVQQFAAAVANDGERLAKETGDGAGKDQPRQPGLFIGTKRARPCQLPRATSTSRLRCSRMLLPTSQSRTIRWVAASHWPAVLVRQWPRATSL